MSPGARRAHPRRDSRGVRCARSRGRTAIPCARGSRGRATFLEDARARLGTVFRSFEELREVGDDYVRAATAKFGGGALPRDAYDDPEPAGLGGVDARESVFEDSGLTRRDAEATGGFEVGVRRRFATEPERARDSAVDAFVEKILDAGAAKDKRAVGARRDDGGRNTGPPDRCHIRHRPWKRLDTLTAHARSDVAVFPVSDAADGRRGRRVGGIALRELDAARCEERSDAVIAHPSVDESVVVVDWIEWDERCGSKPRAGEQEMIEDLRPRRTVQGRRVGQYPVEIEETGGHRSSETQPLSRRRPLDRRDSAVRDLETFCCHLPSTTPTGS